MRTKQEILQQITEYAKQNVFTKEELIAAYNSGSSQTAKSDQVLTKQLGIAEILYYIGGAVIFLGISILLFQNWDILNFATKLLVTLGVGIASYYIGLIFTQKEKTEAVGSAFYLISALVNPIGLAVVFNNMGYDSSSYGVQTIISLIMFGMYFGSYFVFRKGLFILFAIIFGTWFFYSITSFLVGETADWTFFQYRTLVASISYMLLGYSFSKDERKSLSGFLYGFGVFGFLTTALILGGWKPDQNVFWELIYPGLVFGVLFISVNIKSKAFLTFGTIFLMIYILKITSEYFTTGLGWPLALVLAGLSMIGVGYMSLSLKKKYLS